MNSSPILNAFGRAFGDRLSKPHLDAEIVVSAFNA